MAALFIFARPRARDVSDDRLSTFPNINSFDANDLRAAVSQSAQRLRQDSESARQSACRRCRCKNVTVATVPATEPTEDGHRRRMNARHLKAPRGDRSLRVQRLLRCWSCLVLTNAEHCGNEASGLRLS